MLVTIDAVKLLADESVAALFSSDPGPQGPGRVMPNVAGVPAIQVRYPIIQFVLVKADDDSFHLHIFCLWMLPGLAVWAR